VGVRPPPFRLCLVTDRRGTAGRPLLDVVRACLAAGLPAVQLREKDLEDEALLALGRALRAATREAGARLVVNGRPDLARAVAADGVHLPSGGLDPGAARAAAGPGALVGVSAHSVEEVAAAARAGADYVLFGPVYDTPAKRPFGPPQGLARLGAACRAGAAPVLAIGGVTAPRVAEVRAAGASGVAVIRACLAVPDPGDATAALLAACREAWA
jgi:thiamine-phosphate pyrophosphorylase